MISLPPYPKLPKDASRGLSVREARSGVGEAIPRLLPCVTSPMIPGFAMPLLHASPAVSRTGNQGIAVARRVKVPSNGHLLTTSGPLSHIRRDSFQSSPPSLTWASAPGPASSVDIQIPDTTFPEVVTPLVLFIGHRILEPPRQSHLPYQTRGGVYGRRAIDCMK